MEARTNAMHPRSPIGLLGLAVVAAGCGGGGETPQPASDTPTAYQHLASGAAACAEEARQCVEQAQGDTAQLGDCREAFNDCQREQVAPRASDLADAIRDCRESAADCREANADAGAGSCRDDLLECLGESRRNTDDGGVSQPNGSADAGDAGVPGDGDADASCLDRLRACVQNDSPMSCARDVAACIQAQGALPRGPFGPGNGFPRDDESDEDSDGWRSDAGGPDLPDPDLPGPDLPDFDPGSDAGIPSPGDFSPLPDSVRECREQVIECIRDGNMPFECADQADACSLPDSLPGFP